MLAASEQIETTCSIIYIAVGELCALTGGVGPVGTCQRAIHVIRKPNSFISGSKGIIRPNPKRLENIYERAD